MQGRCKALWRHCDNLHRQNHRDRSTCNSVRHCGRSWVPYTVLACIYYLDQRNWNLSQSHRLYL